MKIAVITILFLSVLCAPCKNDSLPVATPPEIKSYNPVIKAIAPETISRQTEYNGFSEILETEKGNIPDDIAELAGRAIWGESGGISDERQRAAVIWCACNRADAWNKSIEDVLIPSQFHGLNITGPVPQEHVELARDVLARWALEKKGYTDVGRALPKEYLFFTGDGNVNHFSTLEAGKGEIYNFN